MINVLEMTPEDFEKLYTKHKLKPRSVNTNPNYGEGCCALGALVAEVGYTPGSDAYEILYRRTNAPQDTLALFGRGFDCGFNGDPHEPYASESVFAPYYDLGYRVGQHMHSLKGRK